MRKIVSAHAFGEDVGFLKERVDLDQFNIGIRVDMGLEEKVFHSNVLGSGIILTARAVEIAPLLSSKTVDLINTGESP